MWASCRTPCCSPGASTASTGGCCRSTTTARWCGARRRLESVPRVAP
uniref:Uncharacterized protein n=1 Tax=Arundo donax TaxID=35708 RepID=A0A0A8ZC88_ARUDO